MSRYRESLFVLVALLLSLTSAAPAFAIEAPRKVHALIIVDRPAIGAEEKNLADLLKQVTPDVKVVGFDGISAVTAYLNSLGDTTNDTLFVYYSGLSGFYPRTEKKFLGNGLKAVPVEKFHSVVRQKRTALTVVAIDTWSRWMISKDAFVGANFEPNSVRVLNRLLAGYAGLVELSSGGRGEDSWAVEGMGGFFTHGLVDALGRTDYRDATWNQVASSAAQSMSENFAEMAEVLRPAPREKTQTLGANIKVTATGAAVLAPSEVVSDLPPALEEPAQTPAPEKEAAQELRTSPVVPSGVRVPRLGIFVQDSSAGVFVTNSGFRTLPAGSIILEINRKSVRTVEEFLGKLGKMEHRERFHLVTRLNEKVRDVVIFSPEVRD